LPVGAMGLIGREGESFHPMLRFDLDCSTCGNDCSSLHEEPSVHDL